jgi:hypothetical protein
VGLSSDDLQGEHNGPPDDENGEYGGGLPPIPVGPAGGQAPWQPMQEQQPPIFPPAYPPLPPSQPYSHSSSHLSYKDPSPWMISVTTLILNEYRQSSNSSVQAFKF